MEAQGEEALVDGASWSLEGAAFLHPKVFDIVKSASLKSTGKAKEKLSLIVQKILAQSN